jgi:hypothetical protein
MREGGSVHNPDFRRLHEVTFSVNVASAIMSGIFLYAPHSIVSRLFSLEAGIETALGMRQTDVHLGYWAFFLPGLALALCIWIALRLSSKTQFTVTVLRSLGGVVAMVTPAICWLCAAYLEKSRYGWTPLKAIQLYELILVLAGLLLFFGGRWLLPWWGSILVISVHYAFWFWQYGPYSILLGFGGPMVLQPILGLISTTAWLLYIKGHLRRDVVVLHGQLSARGRVAGPF